METLQTYRPALQDLALAASPDRMGNRDLPFPIGRVPIDYFDKRVAAFHLDQTQRWLDVRSARTHALLRNALAAELVAAGYSGTFNFGEIIGSDYTITQAIARWAYDAGYGGIAYPSAHVGTLTCWAIFDRAPVIPFGSPQPIHRADPDLVAAIELFGLELP